MASESSEQRVDSALPLSSCYPDAMPIDSRHDLGRARLLKPEALGVPGKRTFRFLIEAERGSAHVWMEKQQLSALALAIQQFLEENPQRQPQAREGSIEAIADPFFDFKAASLGLAYDEATRLFAVLAYDAESVERDQVTLLCWVSRRQVEGVAEEAQKVVAAGRPICPLCKEPMDPEGHSCIRSNGHKAAADEL